MPFTINGVGTWYYGRRNVFDRRDNCQACRAFTTLSSYDADKYFVLAFIPLLRLSSIRVLDECAACRRHRACPLNEWNVSRDDTITATAAAQRKNPADPEAAKTSITGAISFQHKTALDEAAALAEQRLIHDAATMAAIGEGFLYFSRLEDAARAFAISLDASDELQVREMLAFTLARLGRPDEAHVWLEHLFTNRLIDKVGLVYSCVESFQSLGKHLEAIALLDQCQTAMPTAAGQKQFRRYRRISERNLSTGRRFKSPITSPLASIDRTESRFRWRVASWIGPVVVVLAIVAYLMAAVMVGRSREVYVINGTDTIYTVHLNGKSLTLGPMRLHRLHMPEGEIAIQFSGTLLPVDDLTVQLSTPFLLRPFLNRTFVINPDKTALLVWEQATYSQRATGGSDPHSVHVGDVLYEFAGIDYEFEPFPDSVSLSSRSSQVAKQRIDHEVGLSIEQQFGAVANELGEDKAIEMLKVLARFGSESEELWRLLEDALPPDELVAFVKPGLDMRPYSLNWHRAYQVAMERRNAATGLAAQYQAYLHQTPNDPTLIYLAARLEDDEDRQEVEFIRALDAGLKSERPLHWLVYAMLSTGRFERALHFSNRLAAVDPTDRHYHVHVIESLLALGRIREALEKNMVIRDMHPDDGYLAIETVMLHSMLDEQTDAKYTIDQYVARLQQSESSDVIQHWRDYMEAVHLYVRGDSTGYGRQLLAGEQVPDVRFTALVSLGRLNEAMEILDATERADISDWLILFAATTQAGDQTIAETCIGRVIEILEEYPSEQSTRMLEWFSATAPPDSDEVCAARIPRAPKLALMMAMGLRHSVGREQYFSLARSLNCMPTFPYLLWRDLLDVPRTSGGG